MNILKKKLRYFFISACHSEGAQRLKNLNDQNKFFTAFGMTYVIYFLIIFKILSNSFVVILKVYIPLSKFPTYNLAILILL